MRRVRREYAVASTSRRVFAGRAASGRQSRPRAGRPPRVGSERGASRRVRRLFGSATWPSTRPTRRAWSESSAGRRDDFDFLKIKQTIASLAGELEKLRSEREALLQKREDLEAAPACKEDVLALLDAWIDRRAADFPANCRSGLSYYRRHRARELARGQKGGDPPYVGADRRARSERDGNAGESGMLSLFFVLRDQIKAGLREAVEQLDFSAAGPPRAERLETIAAIDKRIDELDKAEAELIEQAEQSGLKL